MKTNIRKLALILIAIVPIAFAESCAPNHARTNARIEKGFNVGAVWTYNHTSKDSLNNENQNFGQLDLDIGYSGRKENNLGFSVQGKMGWRSIPGLDFYLELPSDDPFYYGVGVEVGGGNGGYLIASYYPADVIFITITGRILYWDHQQVLYNPQLSVGWSNKNGSPTVSLFSGYEYFTGDGLDMDMSFDGESSTAGYVNKLIYGGISVQF